MRHTVIRTLNALLACMMLAGCGAQGEAYQPRPTPASQSVIYIYRPYKLLTSQSTPMVTCGHESIELEPGGFDEFVEDTGTVNCAVAGDTTVALKFDAHAGEQYFIKQDVETSGLTTHVRLILMDADVGRDQIKECNRQGIKQ
jgi:hypothetical protein